MPASAPAAAWAAAAVAVVAEGLALVADRVAAAGMGFFELRLPDFGPTDEGEKERKDYQTTVTSASAEDM